jgi:hypothetical protein
MQAKARTKVFFLPCPTDPSEAMRVVGRSGRNERISDQDQPYGRTDRQREWWVGSRLLGWVSQRLWIESSSSFITFHSVLGLPGIIYLNPTATASSACLTSHGNCQLPIQALLQNIDIVTQPCNTYIDVIQRSFIVTQNYVLQTVVVTQSTCFIKMCYRQRS